MAGHGLGQSVLPEAASKAGSWVCHLRSLLHQELGPAIVILMMSIGAIGVMVGSQRGLPLLINAGVGGALLAASTSLFQLVVDIVPSCSHGEIAIKRNELECTLVCYSANVFHDLGLVVANLMLVLGVILWIITNQKDGMQLMIWSVVGAILLRFAQGIAAALLPGAICKGC